MGWHCQVPALRLTLRAAPWVTLVEIWVMTYGTENQKTMFNNSPLLNAVCLVFGQKCLVLLWHCNTWQWGQGSLWLSVQLSATDKMIESAHFTSTSRTSHLKQMGLKRPRNPFQNRWIRGPERQPTSILSGVNTVRASDQWDFVNLFESEASVIQYLIVKVSWYSNTMIHQKRI